MKKAKLFKNGQSQAVRLPKEFRFDGESVYAKKTANGVFLFPSTDSWSSLIDSLKQFSDDFLSDRNQPREQERDDLD